MRLILWVSGLEAAQRIALGAAAVFFLVDISIYFSNLQHWISAGLILSGTYLVLTTKKVFVGIIGLALAFGGMLPVFVGLEATRLIYHNISLITFLACAALRINKAFRRKKIYR